MARSLCLTFVCTFQANTGPLRRFCSSRIGDARLRVLEIYTDYYDGAECGPGRARVPFSWDVRRAGAREKESGNVSLTL